MWKESQTKKKKHALTAEGRAVIKATLWEVDASAWLKGILEVLASVDGRRSRDRNYRHEQRLKQRWKCGKVAGQ